MTHRLDIRIHVDSLLSFQVATDRTIGGWFAKPLGVNWSQSQRCDSQQEAERIAIRQSMRNVDRLQRGEGLVTITQEQAEEIHRQIYEAMHGRPQPAARAQASFEVPECIKRPARQLDMFGRTG